MPMHVSELRGPTLGILPNMAAARAGPRHQLRGGGSGTAKTQAAEKKNQRALASPPRWLLQVMGVISLDS